VIWDTIIVGQGLAGTTLAWILTQAGQRVLLLDANDPSTSSKIAAGLITPITGQRLTLNWQDDHVWSTIRGFYRRIERETGAHFFHDRSAVRLFASDAERALWAKRQTDPGYQRHLIQPPSQPLLEPSVADTDGGGFAMHAAQLDVAAYLDASRSKLPWEARRIDWLRDVVFEDDAITIGPHRAQRVVTCEGAAAAFSGRAVQVRNRRDPEHPCRATLAAALDPPRYLDRTNAGRQRFSRRRHL
jgi:glycine oxidase